ncbi:hypothetical protein K493DRAFT_312863 [Basidiobolus meristosporus CBS 931.73]|uniref:LON-domain-containing protein n=1 Tax=Basidiobolus meristosporus CBS 931.73 TaxID=1314790 RepID=A0A1Y1YRZ9_9FUNG|nr:hypothetical protein K493DRAFT_312863 [Basidiobolus meristosporus CBS 931.73]|eukprot:ORY00335.1 hypothetical protein K493DRAFT_312863 [Basidiobolus meristosporus CBS 931.73]
MSLPDPAKPPLITSGVLTRIFSCPQCEAVFTHPVTLSCGYTLCFHCVPSKSEFYNRFTCPISTCPRRTHPAGDLKVDVLVSRVAEKVASLGPVGPSKSLPAGVLRDLSVEVECQICFNLLWQPLTTICGHTFCKLCLLRSLDHYDSCPICRHRLPDYQFFNNHVPNRTISRFLECCLPNELETRRAALETEKNGSVDEVPLFICSLVFPRMRCFLHIFEPRYRLLIRRCLETEKKRFGMVLPGVNDTVMMSYGTMLEVKSYEVLPDGRLLIEAVGVDRFRVLNYENHDGYFQGRVELVEDTDSSASFQDSPALHELLRTIREFIDHLRTGSAPWLNQRLDSTYGAMPTDPTEFSFWAASILPIDEYQKYHLLTLTSTQTRLSTIAQLTAQLKERWWFSFGGFCNIL